MNTKAVLPVTAHLLLPEVLAFMSPETFPEDYVDYVQLGLAGIATGCMLYVAYKTGYRSAARGMLHHFLLILKACCFVFVKQDKLNKVKLAKSALL